MAINLKPEPRYEYCQICDEKTGRAGRSDDSIYCDALKCFAIEHIVIDRGGEIGPLCSGCYYALEALGIVED